MNGGFRYLPSGDVRLVRKGLRERQRIFRNAPHLVHVLPFLLPMLHDGPPVSDRAMGAAMRAYDLAGAARLGRHRRLSGPEAIGHMPTFDGDVVRGGYLYFDAQADDAQLTRQLAPTATLDFGAVVANHVGVLASVKRGRDPNGILNPGKLGLPDGFGDVTWPHAIGRHAT